MSAAAQAEAALDWAIAYVKEREAFGQRLSEFQATRFEIAELGSEVSIARVYVDWCLERSVRGDLDVKSAAIAKYWVSEMAYRVIDDCLQLFGGNGYMRDFPISRAWVDARIARIYGGSTEIMQELISRQFLQ